MPDGVLLGSIFVMLVTKTDVGNSVSGCADVTCDKPTVVVGLSRVVLEVVVAESAVVAVCVVVRVDKVEDANLEVVGTEEGDADEEMVVVVVKGEEEVFVEVEV